MNKTPKLRLRSNKSILVCSCWGSTCNCGSISLLQSLLKYPACLTTIVFHRNDSPTRTYTRVETTKTQSGAFTLSRNFSLHPLHSKVKLSKIQNIPHIHSFPPCHTPSHLNKYNLFIITHSKSSRKILSVLLLLLTFPFFLFLC